MRNLDLTALRSFVTVADLGSVTKAAAKLNVTQSAVSMQLKRMEEFLGLALMDRSARSLGLTPKGELLHSYAKRMLELNDECWGRLAGAEFAGEVTFGVPYDIVYPHIPGVLKQFSSLYPNIKVNLVSSTTLALLERFEHGDLDLIMTTELQGTGGGEKLCDLRLAWIGAVGGNAWRERPLRLATHEGCIFWPILRRAVDEAGIPWEKAVESDNEMIVSASLSADLAVAVRLDFNAVEDMVEIDHNGALPDLPPFQANIYIRQDGVPPYLKELYQMVCRAYHGGAKPAQLKAG